MLAAAALYAVSGVFARWRLRDVPVLSQAFYSLLFAAVLMWIVILRTQGVGPLPARAVTWAAIVWLGVLGAGIAGYLFYFMLHAIGPTRASLITYTIPVVGVTLGVVVLKEPLDFDLVLGTVLIVAGVAVVNRRAKGR